MAIDTFRILHVVLCVLIVLPCTALAQAVAAAPEAPADRPLKVLFLGNSLTYYNNMPSTVATLALAARSPRVLKVTQITVPDAHLEQLWSYRSTRYAISETNWDFVVLQESPARLLNQTDRAFAAAREIDAAIKKDGARTILYATWIRKGRWEVLDAMTQLSYALAKELGAEIAPVGPAWQQVLRSDPAVTLFDPDDLHPTPAGSYLAACVLFLVILKEESCPALESDRLSKHDVAAVAGAAISAVRSGR